MKHEWHEYENIGLKISVTILWNGRQFSNEMLLSGMRFEGFLKQRIECPNPLHVSAPSRLRGELVRLHVNSVFVLVSMVNSFKLWSCRFDYHFSLFFVLAAREILSTGLGGWLLHIQTFNWSADTKLLLSFFLFRFHSRHETAASRKKALERDENY